MPTASATTMPLPTIAVQVSSIAPQPAYAGALPIVLLLHGQGLDEVQTARLLADGKPSLNAAIQHDADQLVLTVATLPEPLNGEVSYRLELDGTVLETPPIVLRDFLDRQRVQGVLPEYDYTSRVASDAAGAYTRMRAEPNMASQPGGMLRNGDEVDILSTNRDGWYLVRIHTSSDAAQIATVGWIERWLLDNQGVPATPTPAPKRLAFVGRVYSAPIDKAIQCGISFDSSIYGSVENSRGTGIAGARLRVTSADGKNVYNVATGRGGIYSVPGLGCTTWYVSLISVPNAPNGFDANRVPVRNLNGGRFTSAEVRFKQQK
jgi:eukaryotic-like serine/threonine-protein kinase